MTSKLFKIFVILLPIGIVLQLLVIAMAMDFQKEGPIKDVKLETKKEITLKDAEELIKVEDGGWYSPSNFTSRWRIAIIVCFRNRDQHLGPFHYHMHRFLQRQQLDYKFYLVNQTDSLAFNRAKLFNVGFAEALKDGKFDCFVFHDIDFLPVDDRNSYNCSDFPRHMTVFYSNHPYRRDKGLENYFGGVVMLTEKHLIMVNGWSNRYWGWGGEDDDMRRRINFHKLKILRYPKEIGTYVMLPHEPAKKNPKRNRILQSSKHSMHVDGLNSLKYKLMSRIKHKLFTSLNVDISSY